MPLLGHWMEGLPARLDFVLPKDDMVRELLYVKIFGKRLQGLITFVVQ